MGCRSRLETSASPQGTPSAHYLTFSFPSLLVLIGFTAAFIISLFPRPQSAKKTVRRILAKSIDNSSELFMEEIKGFLLKARAHDNPTARDADLDAKLSPFRARFLGLAVGHAPSSNSSTYASFAFRANYKPSNRNSSMRGLSRASGDHGRATSMKRWWRVCRSW